VGRVNRFFQRRLTLMQFYTFVTWLEYVRQDRSRVRFLLRMTAINQRYVTSIVLRGVFDTWIRIAWHYQRRRFKARRLAAFLRRRSLSTLLIHFGCSISSSFQLRQLDDIARVPDGASLLSESNQQQLGEPITPSTPGGNEGAQTRSSQSSAQRLPLGDSLTRGNVDALAAISPAVPTVSPLTLPSTVSPAETTATSSPTASTPVAIRDDLAHIQSAFVGLINFAGHCIVLLLVLVFKFGDFAVPLDGVSLGI